MNFYSSVKPGYPRKIINDWPGLPENIDAAVTWPETGKKLKKKKNLKFDFFKKICL